MMVSEGPVRHILKNWAKILTTRHVRVTSLIYGVTFWKIGGDKLSRFYILLKMIQYLERNIEHVILGRVSFKFPRFQSEIDNDPRSGCVILIRKRCNLYCSTSDQ